ncbi:MAG: P1 family peptidase [Ignavibacteriales bacterium]|nr:P1 family peptidase [Ignavibacteriales bacterium]
MKRIAHTACLVLLAAAAGLGQESSRPRLRDLGVEVGIFRTGVTAILPHGGNLFQEKVPAAIVVGNGFGKLIGSTQVEELGQVETPILLTNTLSVWEVANGVVDYMLALPGNETVRSINPVVGETNDGWLNDIRGRHVTRAHAVEAIRSAQRGPVPEGAVGAGAGTVCFGWKGGIGTSSRLLPPILGASQPPARQLPARTALAGGSGGSVGLGYTVGVLVQTNYGGVLELAGVPIGKELGQYSFKEQLNYGDGSCMIVAATDAPLNSAQLKRLARRALLALGKTGSAMSHGSGDYVIAFSTAAECRIKSTANRTEPSLRFREDDLSPLFQAIVEATEEAIYNSLLKATDTKGYHQHESKALPLGRVKELLNKYGRSR